ncbi:MAG: outer membrane protein [Thermodesulfobacteriota bacterium]
MFSGITARRFARKVLTGTAFILCLITGSALLNTAAKAELLMLSGGPHAGPYLGVGIGTGSLTGRQFNATATEDVQGFGASDFQVVPVAGWKVSFIDMFVFGLETHISLATILSQRTDADTSSINMKRPFEYGVTGLAGYLVNNDGLLFGQGGYSRARTIILDGPKTDINGWIYGAGAETIVGDSISFRINWKHTLFEDPATTATNDEFEVAQDQFLFSLIYRFGGNESTGPRAGSNELKHGFQISASPGRSAGVMAESLEGAGSGQNDLQSDGYLASFAISYDFTLPNDRFVLGIGGSYSIADIEYENITDTLNAKVEQENDLQFFGRFGFKPTPSSMIYSDIGWTRGDIEVSRGGTAGGIQSPGTARATSVELEAKGLMLGLGMRLATDIDGMFVDVNWQYVRYETDGVEFGNSAPFTTATQDISSNRFTIGVGYSLSGILSKAFY